MQRRAFLKRGLAATGGMFAGGAVSASIPDPDLGNRPFHLKYAPHFGMFKHTAGRDWIDQLDFAAGQGFTTWEDLGLKARPVALQEQIARALQVRGMTPGAFVATHRWSALSALPLFGDIRQAVLKDFRDSVIVARRCHARWLVMASCDRASFDSNARGDGTRGFGQHEVDLLKRCSAMLEPHGMVLLVDPLYDLHVGTGGLVCALQQAVDVCRVVDSPACKVRLDLYQQSIDEDEWTRLLDHCGAEVAYLQCGDKPGRREPGTGAIDYRRIFQELHANGFDGILAMEHGNAFPGADGELAVVKAYRGVDNF